MQWNDQGLAQVERPAEQERAVADDERVSHVGPRCPVDDKRARAGEQEREERRRTPLARRHPHLIGDEQHRDDAAIGRVEDVFAVDAK